MILPPVRIVSLGDWRTSLDGLTEHRLAIGQSSLGFHHSVERSREGGEGGGGMWSDPLPSLGAATREGAGELYACISDYDDPDPPEPSARHHPQHPPSPA